MNIVIDTSALLAVALGEPSRARLIAITTGRKLIAPAVLPFEVGNSLIGLVRKKRVSEADVVALWQSISKAAVQHRQVNFDVALALALEHGIYAYDAYFLECALATRAPILTFDSRMKAVAGNLGLECLE